MSRIPPIQCLTTFEALARLRSVTLAAEELCVTPSAVSHRVRQLEQIIGTKLFGRADFSLTTEGSEYLAHVREGLTVLGRFPGRDAAQGKRKLRVAVTPTFARSILMPRLRSFTLAYPEIDLTLQVSIPLLDVVAEDADLMIRFGTGRYADVEHVCILTDEVTPLASPAFLRDNGPIDSVEDLLAAKLIKSPLEPWRTWFLAHGVDAHRNPPKARPSTTSASCATQLPWGWASHWCASNSGSPGWTTASWSASPRGTCRAPMRITFAGAQETLDRWECAAFAEWLRRSVS